MTRYIGFLIFLGFRYCKLWIVLAFLLPRFTNYRCDLYLLQVGHEAFEQNASGGFPNDGGGGFGQGFDPFDNPFDIFGQIFNRNKQAFGGQDVKVL